jgi:hypothetical protein
LITLKIEAIKHKYRLSPKGGSNASINIIHSVNDLDSSQIEALTKYTGDDYVNINNSLRGLETLSADNEETVNIIKSILSKASLPEDMTLYRGTSTEALGSLKNLSPEELIGKTFTEPDFMSTSTESTVAKGTFSGNMQIEIAASQGSHGLDISSISNMQMNQKCYSMQGKKCSLQVPKLGVVYFILK